MAGEVGEIKLNGLVTNLLLVSTKQSNHQSVLSESFIRRKGFLF